MPASDSSSLLLKTATPDLYRRNAFRLTGLPVTATAREVARQADKLKMLADLGGLAAEQLAVVPGMEAPTVEEIREAAQRLKDVEARALDEFFWFWPEDWEKPDGDQAFAAIKSHDLDSAFAIWANREVETECLRENVIATHNIALVLHMRAIEWALSDLHEPLPPSRMEKVRGCWKDAFDRWEWLADDDRLWDVFKARIRQVNDPALTSGFARRLRGELPQAFDKINAELALSYAWQARRGEAQWHVAFLKSTHLGQDDVGGTLDAVLAPVRARIERAVEAALQATKVDKRSGISQAMKLLDAAEPLLAVFGMFYETDHSERCGLLDEAAKAALGCAVEGYNSSNQALEKQPPPLGHALDPKKVVNEAFIQALNRVGELATDLELRQRIEQNIQTALGNRQFDTKIKPVLATLVAIKELTTTAPAQRLGRIKSEVIPKVDALLKPGVLDDEARKMLGNSLAGVFREIALSANNAFQQPVLGMEALALAIRYARDPELIAKLKQDSHIMSQNMAVSGQRTAGGDSGNGCLWTALALGGLFLIWIITVGSNDSKNKYSAPYQPSPPVLPAPVSRYQSSPTPIAPAYKHPDPNQVPAGPKLQLSTNLEPESVPDKNGWHVWKNREKKEITAKMLSYDGTTVVLETKDGKTYAYPFTGLAEGSQLLAFKLGGRVSTKETPSAPIAQALPATGVYRGSNVQTANTGPLTIRTRAGSGNFYVKLVGRYSGSERLVIFVHDGATVHDINVPAGTYELRYASGTTWYGEEDLFGPDTSYSKAESDFSFGDGDGYTVELYKQVGGNLQTSPINKNNF